MDSGIRDHCGQQMRFIIVHLGLSRAGASRKVLLEDLRVTNRVEVWVSLGFFGGKTFLVGYNVNGTNQD